MIVQPREAAEREPTKSLTALRALVEVTIAAFFAPKLCGRLVRWVVDDHSLMGWAFDGQRAVIASAVTEKLIAWSVVFWVLAIAFHYGPLRQAIASVRGTPRRAGWIFASITAAMQVLTLVLFFIRDRSLIWEPSWFNLYMSIATGLGGGVAEELAFRGLVVLRLREAGMSQATQVVVSALLFGAAHASWSASQTSVGLFAMLMPVAGTALLGGLLARAFQLSGYRILPVALAHVAINAVVEPGLLLSYFGG